MGHDGAGRRFVPVRQHGPNHSLTAGRSDNHAKNRRQCQKAGERRSEAARAQTRKCAQKDKPKKKSEEHLRRTNHIRNSWASAPHRLFAPHLSSQAIAKANLVRLGSGKIVGTHGVARDRPDLRNGGDTGRALSDGASRLQERDQERQRKDFVTGLLDVIKPNGKLWLP